jgi:hypothetical protein
VGELLALGLDRRQRRLVDGADRVAQGRRLVLADPEEDRAVEDLALRLVQRPVGIVEVEAVRRAGRAQQATVEVPAPAVLRTHDLLGAAGAADGAQLRATVAADIEEGAHRARGIARDDEALARDRRLEVVTGLADHADLADVHPLAGEDALDLLVEDLL